MSFISEHYRKIAAGVTLMIVAMLVMMGPASALTLGLNSFSNSAPVKGELVTTTASLNVQANERVDLQEMELLMESSAGNRLCRFEPDGSPISGCDGITLELISDTTQYGTGYGYKYIDGNETYGWGNNTGYSNGVLTYKITVDTSAFTPATYSVFLRTSVEAHLFRSATQSLRIKPVTTLSTDLLVSNFIAQSRSLVAGKELVFAFNLQNKGNLTLSNVKWRLESGTGAVATGNVASLAPGKGGIMMNKFTYATPGTYTLRAVVDPGNEIDEYNELNNEQNLIIRVS